VCFLWGRKWTFVCSYYFSELGFEGSAIAQAFSRWPLAAEAWVRYWSGLCGICGGQSSNRDRFFSEHLGLPLAINALYQWQMLIWKSGLAEGILYPSARPDFQNRICHNSVLLLLWGEADRHENIQTKQCRFWYWRGLDRKVPLRYF
jgi:hypothetical protein